MKKKIFLLLLILVMMPLNAFAEPKVRNATSNTYAGSNNGQGGGCNTGELYCWGSYAHRYENHASVRITVVDVKGNRLKLNVGGKKYESATLDFYDYRNLDETKNRHMELFNNDPEPMYYMSCGTVQQGGDYIETLCMRKDYEGTKPSFFNKQHDGEGKKYVRLSKDNDINTSHYYKYLEVSSGNERFPKQLPYSFGVNNGSYTGNKLSSIISSFQNGSNKNKFYKIFEDLMGIKIDDVLADQSSSCGTNKKKLEEAFMIFEPVSLIGGKVTGLDSPTNPVPENKIGFYGSATELALFTYDANHTVRSNPAALPSIYGATSLTGDDGKNFGAKEGGKDCKNKNQGCYNFYYKNVLKSISNKSVVDYLSKQDSYNTRLNNTVYENSKGKNNIKKGFGIGALYLKDADPNINLKCYDYSVDVACTNCDSNNEDNAAYVIQDTTNWEAIESAGSSSTTENDVQKCVNKHFIRQGGKVKCREEYHVFLPNQRNKITVQVGRYFTLNKNTSDTNTLTIPNDIPDFRPISVTKTRYCKGSDPDLNAFKNSSDNDFKCGTGDIKINYYEGIESNYSYEGNLVPYGTKTSSKISKGMLVQTMTEYYTLNNNVFRYLRRKDNLAVHSEQAGIEYLDLKVGNLPISYSNKKGNKAKITFKYSLPTCDNNSHMANVLGIGNNQCSLTSDNGTSDNVYKKYLNGKSTDDESIDDSACVKLYGKKFLRSGSDIKSNSNLSNDSYIRTQQTNLGECIKGRENNKNGNCINNSELVSPEVSSGNNYYTCLNNVSELKPGKPSIPNCPEGTTYDPTSKTCNPVNNGNPHFCEPVGDNYYNKTGVVVSKEEYENSCCSQKNTFGRTWNPNDGGYCCPKDQPYNELTGKCESPCKKLNCEKNANGAEACCFDGNKTQSCGYWNSSGKLICPGKPSLSSLVYRTIDPLNPLVTQNGSTRSAGLNWCSYNSNGVLKCGDDPENYIITDVLKKNVTDDSEAIYKVTLTPESINRIRDYNDKNKYDDWDLECDANGKNCKSKFLHDSNFKLGLDGKCSNNITDKDCAQ